MPPKPLSWTRIDRPSSLLGHQTSWPSIEWNPYAASFDWNDEKKSRRGRQGVGWSEVDEEPSVFSGHAGLGGGRQRGRQSGRLAVSVKCQVSNPLARYGTVVNPNYSTYSCNFLPPPPSSLLRPPSSTCQVREDGIAHAMWEQGLDPWMSK